MANKRMGLKEAFKILHENHIMTEKWDDELTHGDAEKEARLSKAMSKLKSAGAIKDDTEPNKAEWDGEPDYADEWEESLDISIGEELENFCYKMAEDFGAEYDDMESEFIGAIEDARSAFQRALVKGLYTITEVGGNHKDDEDAEDAGDDLEDDEDVDYDESPFEDEDDDEDEDETFGESFKRRRIHECGDGCCCGKKKAKCDDEDCECEDDEECDCEDGECECKQKKIKEALAPEYEIDEDDATAEFEEPFRQHMSESYSNRKRRMPRFDKDMPF